MRKAASPKRASGKMKVMLRRAEGAFFLSSQTFATKSAKRRPEQVQQMSAGVSAILNLVWSSFRRWLAGAQ
jgi:hypothetical protein